MLHLEKSPHSNEDPAQPEKKINHIDIYIKNTWIPVMCLTLSYAGDTAVNKTRFPLLQWLNEQIGNKPPVTLSGDVVFRTLAPLTP